MTCRVQAGNPHDAERNLRLVGTQPRGTIGFSVFDDKFSKDFPVLIFRVEDTTEGRARIKDYINQKFQDEDLEDREIIVGLIEGRCADFYRLRDGRYIATNPLPIAN